MSFDGHGMVALIPARAGSVRIPGKNLKLLRGHPLLAYAIHSARESGKFARIVVSTEDEQTIEVARHYGADTIRRPSAWATHDAADVLWVRHALTVLNRPWSFAILRPTSPFRTAETIRRGFALFQDVCDTATSVRAVEVVTQHPGKMWECAGPGYKITPLLSGTRSDGVPWHSAPTQSLPKFYVQNACLEMGWASNLETFKTIHGKTVYPLFTEGYEGFDLNTDRDWRDAEWLLDRGLVALPDPTPVETAAQI